MKPLFWFKVIIGVTVAIVSALLLLLIFSFIGIRSDDPAKHVALYSNAALFLGVFLGGGASARESDSPRVSAVTCGGICAVLVLIPSLLFSQWEANSLLRVAVTVCAAILGSLLLRGREGATKKRRSVKRRREIAKKYS